MSIIEHETIDQLLDTILNNIDQGIAILNKQKNILYSNNAFNRIIGKFSFENNQVYKLEDYFTGFMENNQTEGICKLKDTSQMVEYKILPTKDGNSEKLLLFIKERDDRKELIEMYEAIIYALKDGIMALDVNGNMKIYNFAQESIDNLSSQVVINNSPTDIYNLSEDTSLLLKTLKTKVPIYDQRQIYTTVQGWNIDAITSVHPLYNKNKNFIGVASITQDYSQIQKILEENFADNSIKKNNKKHLTSKSSSSLFTFDDIITQDDGMNMVKEWAKLAAANDSNVLLIGDTGTGKELFAQSIHTNSKRRNKPFIAINSAAIPETLLESLLFGTTKGAFTGAVDKAGLFEKANGGTVFLDEINSMSMTLQAKLLRALEERSIMRLGDHRSIPIDVRIISSCNKNPINLIENKSIRDDLFYRLAVVYLTIPLLKDRKGDIELLASIFINKYNKEMNKNIATISEEVKLLFYGYNWPGNVRQLKHTIESAITLADKNSKVLTKECIPLYIFENQDSVYEKQYNPNAFDHFTENVDELMNKIKYDEEQEILRCLRESNGNISKAAKEMGMSRQKLHYKINKLKLK